jgi:hypothetical protein
MPSPKKISLQTKPSNSPIFCALQIGQLKEVSKRQKQRRNTEENS